MTEEVMTNEEQVVTPETTETPEVAVEATEEVAAEEVDETPAE